MTANELNLQAVKNMKSRQKASAPDGDVVVGNPGQLLAGEFHVVCSMIRVRPTTKRAAMLVLIDGYRICDVAEKLKLQPQQVFNTCKRIVAGHNQILEGYSRKPLSAIDQEFQKTTDMAETA